MYRFFRTQNWKSIFTLSIISMLFFVSAVQGQGMDFEHNTTWENVLAKAKEQNKYIFVDCFTTWCGPCKAMSKNIFPQKEVGDFYNTNFVNLKVQLDTTEADSEEVQKWYATGRKLATDYQVNVFPTYLIFNSDGQIVHRAVGSMGATAFIEKGKEATMPEKQFYTLKKKYESGERNPEFLYNVTKAAIAASDQEFTKTASESYLKTQKDLFSKNNLDILQQLTQSSDDKYFPFLIENEAKISTINGNDDLKNTLQMIVLQEEVFPKAFEPGNKAIDWAKLEQSIHKKYPSKSAETIALGKIIVLQIKGKWNAYFPAVVKYMDAYEKSVTDVMKNDFAWNFFEKTKDKALLAKAAVWSKSSFAKTNNPMFIDTYANLMYKMGKTTAAIKGIQSAIKYAKAEGADTQEYEATLAKMKKGIPTWE